MVFAERARRGKKTDLGVGGRDDFFGFFGVEADVGAVDHFFFFAADEDALAAVRSVGVAAQRLRVAVVQLGHFRVAHQFVVNLKLEISKYAI